MVTMLLYWSYILLQSNPFKKKKKWVIEEKRRKMIDWILETNLTVSYSNREEGMKWFRKYFQSIELIRLSMWIWDFQNRQEPVRLSEYGRWLNIAFLRYDISFQKVDNSNRLEIQQQSSYCCSIIHEIHKPHFDYLYI